MKTTLLTSALLLAGLLGSAQNHAYLDRGNFETPICSDGQLFWDQSATDGGFEWPRTSVPADEKFVAFTGHFWIGGLDDQGSLHISAQTYLQQDFPYTPGPVNAAGNWNQVWRISRSEVDQFQTDLANGALNFANYPAIQTWPAFAVNSLGNNVAIAPFIDMDGDPFDYDPTAGDHPDFPGDQAIYAVFHDSAGSGLGLQIELFAYLYECTTDAYDDICFLRYKISNYQPQQYEQVHAGLFMDFAIGDESDDFMGSDSLLSLIYSYNADAIDGDYGTHPPAFGIVALSEPATSAAYYVNNLTVIGNPATAQQHYDYLRARWTDGTALVNNGGDGYGAGVQTSWAFSGDAGFCGGASNGWTEMTAGVPPFDRRGVLSTGPFTLVPGGLLYYEFAAIPARANTNDQLGSVCELKNKAALVRQHYAQGSTPCAPVMSAAAPAQTISFSLAPNPAQDELRLSLSAASGALTGVEVLDLSGRVLHSEEVPGGQSRILSVAHLPAGVYLLRVKTQKGIAVQRWMKE